MRLHRYFKDAERMRRQALDELYRLRREEDRGLRPAPGPDTSPAQNEPEPAAEAPAQNEPERPHPSACLASFNRPAGPSPSPEVAAAQDEPGAPAVHPTPDRPGA
jgi:hypothetical protein